MTTGVTSPGYRPRWYAGGIGLILAGALSAPARCAATRPEPAATASIAWDQVIGQSRTAPSLQVVVNPRLLRDSPIHQAAHAALADLGADYVRYVPWLPYPRLAVAELEPPAEGRTSWDFSLLDPPLLDFLKANGDHPAMINFSTIPAWLFQTDQPVTYPRDPREVTWSYTQGTELRAGGLKALGEYYARLVSWYVNGGFVDEAGRRHESGHRLKIPYWEVFNEPDLEHHMTPPQYTERYDAVVAAVRQVSPDTKFVGVSVALPSQCPEMFEYFLNPANHRPGIPLDMISYHFYALVDQGQSAEHWQYTFFDQADRFIATARYIDAIRRRLSPETKVAMNEIGSILPGDRESATRDSLEDPHIPPEYWHASAALYAYVFLESVKLGIEVVSASQLIGYPTQYPSVTMLDWNTGTPNARYWVLKLLHENLRPGDKLVKTTSLEKYPDTAIQAFITPRGRKLLLINKRRHPSTVTLPEAVAGAGLAMVDASSGDRIARAQWSGRSLVLPPFAVAVVTLPN